MDENQGNYVKLNELEDGKYRLVINHFNQKGSGVHREWTFIKCDEPSDANPVEKGNSFCFHIPTDELEGEDGKN